MRRGRDRGAGRRTGRRAGARRRPLPLRPDAAAFMAAQAPGALGAAGRTAADPGGARGGARRGPLPRPGVPTPRCRAPAGPPAGGDPRPGPRGRSPRMAHALGTPARPRRGGRRYVHRPRAGGILPARRGAVERDPGVPDSRVVEHLHARGPRSRPRCHRRPRGSRPGLARQPRPQQGSAHRAPGLRHGRARASRRALLARLPAPAAPRCSRGAGRGAPAPAPARAPARHAATRPGGNCCSAPRTSSCRAVTTKGAATR